MLNSVLDESRVQNFFNNDIKFVEKLNENKLKVYRQDDGEIAVVMDFIQEDITEATLDFFQIVCEALYFKYDETFVNMYVITLGCRVLVNEHSMPSIAKFSIKMCSRDYSYL